MLDLEFANGMMQIIREYPPPAGHDSYPSPTLWKCLNLFYKWSDFDIPWTNIETRYAVTMNNLGPYSAELYLYSEMKRRISSWVGRTSLPVQQEDEPDISETLQISHVSSKATALLEIDQILCEFRPFFEDNSIPAKIPFAIGLDWCSPKMKILVDILVEHHSPTFQGIVFVEQRQVAACLARVLPCVLELKDLIRCAELVGQGSTEDRISRGMAMKSHHDTVKLFRDKKINLRECLLHLP
jgi:endoribonuclease Dicer